jgi:HlyD family secretion protein
MKRFLLFLGILFLGIGMLAASGCGEPTAAETTGPSADSGAPLDRVTAGKPERKTLKLYTSQPGRVQAFEETPLFSKVTGYVDEIKVDIGDHVKKDDVLIKLWIPEMEDDLKQRQALVAQADAQVKQAEAAVEAAQAGVSTAEARVSLADAGVLRAEADFQRWQSEHDRMKDLASRGSLTQKLVDETLNQFRSAEAARDEIAANVRAATAALKEAEANVKKAEADQVAAEAKARVAGADLSRTQTMLNYGEIKAPYDGIITRRNVDTRHYVHPANGGMTKPLLVVAQTKKVRIFVDIPEMEAPMVDGGENADSAVVRVQSLGGREFNAHVTRTSWSLDASNRSLRTELDIDNEEGLFRPGMYAMVDILLEQRDDVLTLPISAIVRDGRDAYCCLVESGKIHRKPLKLGLRSGSDVEVLEGLSENETVVIARADSLQDGQSVEVIQTEK